MSTSGVRPPVLDGLAHVMEDLRSYRLASGASLSCDAAQSAVTITSHEPQGRRKCAESPAEGELQRLEESSPPSYALISPVRDEASHIRRTLEAIVAQTHLPLEWVIVDDGSTDGTPEIVSEYAADHPWIRLVRSGLEGRRQRGSRIVDAFKRGRSELHRSPDVTVKLDGDLYLPPHYFAWVAEVFARVPAAGVVGGTGYVWDGMAWAPEKAANHNVVGYCKAYRTACLDDIGGLQSSMGWDGIDEYSARA